MAVMWAYMKGVHKQGAVMTSFDKKELIAGSFVGILGIVMLGVFMINLIPLWVLFIVALFYSPVWSMFFVVLACRIVIILVITAIGATSSG